MDVLDHFGVDGNTLSYLNEEYNSMKLKMMMNRILPTRT